MANTASFQLKNYSVPVSSAIPSELLPVSIDRSPAIDVRGVVVNSASGSASAGGQINFFVPTDANGYIRSGSMYLKFSVSTTGGATWGAGNSVGDFTSLLNRASVSVAGTTIERVDSVGNWKALFLAHTSGAYYEADAIMLERARDGATSATADQEVCLPLSFLSCFNNGHAFPLWLCNNNLVITLDLSSVVEGIYDSAGASTNFSITNPRLGFDLIKCDPSFINGLRQEMAGGKMYNLPILNVRSVIQADQTDQTVVVPVSCSSMKAYFYTSRLKSATTDAGLYKSGTISSIQLFCDGQLQNSDPLDTLSSQYNAINASLSKQNEYSVASAPAMSSQALYRTDYYWTGISTRCSDSHGIWNGKSVQTVQARVQKSTASGSAYHFIVYDGAVSIDANGQVVLLQ